MSNELKKFNFEITSLEQAMQYAKLIADSDLVPKDYKGKPGNVLIAMQFGSEVGLMPLQAVQNISVINGRPALWGDAMLALVQRHSICEYIKEYIKDKKAYCIVKRQGEDEHIVTFSEEDAKKAGLWGKSGPWTQYPDRMLQMRARSFALRDKFSDILKGIAMYEEVQDYQIIEAKESKKNEAKEKLNVLLANKSNNEIVAKIENATSVEELTEIKDEVRDLLKEKHAQLIGEHKQDETT